MWALVIGAGVCMTASAYFGIDSLTVISYIAVPLVAVLGTVAMVMAIRQGNGTIVDQFAVSSGSLTVVGGAGLVVGSFVSVELQPRTLPALPKMRRQERSQRSWHSLSETP